jgi:short-subunit dehydrogenase
MKKLENEMKLAEKNYKKYLQFREFQKTDGSFEGPKFQLRVVLSDFKKFEIDREMDVALCVVNHEYQMMAPFKDLTDKELEDMIDINLVSRVSLTKLYTTLLNKRENKSGLLIISSQLQNIPAAGTLAYSASARCLSLLGTGLHYELSKKVDVLTYEPGEIEERGFLTSLLPTISSESAVKTCMKDFGYQALAYGTLQ